MDKKVLTETLMLLDDIMTTHSLTEREAVAVLRSFCSMTHTLSITERMPLVNSGLLLLDDTVNEGLLFKDKEVIQTSLNLQFESVPKCPSEHLDIAHKLEKELVPADIDKDEMIKHYADKYFSGDKAVARYFIIFRFLFPDKTSPGSINWTRHFKVGFDSTKRWVPTASNAKKFHDIYRKKDIGIFLAGAYYAVLDSVNVSEGTCFMTTSDKFMSRYDSWYEYAADKIKAAQEKEKSRQKMIDDNNIVDTLS